MKKARTRVAAAALSLGFASLAQAIPIYFDFTGTINGAGTTLAGGFTFETDRLVEASPNPALRSWIDWQPVDPAEPLAYLAFGGRDVTFSPGAGTTYALMNFSDACPSTGCPPQQVENFSLFAGSTDGEFTADFTGSINTYSFYFSSAAFVRLPDFPFIQGFDYFDGAQLDPTSIVSLPLYDAFGYFSEDTYDCVDGSCVSSGPRDFGISIDTVTRGIGARSVPEPGTLGLSGAGFLAALLMRRRKPRQQHA